MKTTDPGLAAALALASCSPTRPALDLETGDTATTATTALFSTQRLADGAHGGLWPGEPGADDPRPAWSVPTVAAGPCWDPAAIYVVLGTSLVALDPADGTGRWATLLSADLHLAADPAVVGDTVVVAWTETVPASGTTHDPSYETHALAAQVSTGAVLWSEDLGPGSAGGPSVTVDGSAVYLAEPDRVLRLDLDSGTVAWEVRTNGLGGVVVEGDVVGLLAADQGYLVLALDAVTGLERWRRAISSWSSELLAAHDRFYVRESTEGTREGRVLGFRATDGAPAFEVRQERDLPKDLWAWRLLALGDDLVWVENGAMVRARRDGTDVWRNAEVVERAEEPYGGAITAIGDRLVYRDQILRAATGTLAGTLPLPEAEVSDVIPFDGGWLVLGPYDLQDDPGKHPYTSRTLQLLR